MHHCFFKDFFHVDITRINFFSTIDWKIISEQLILKIRAICINSLFNYSSTHASSYLRKNKLKIISWKSSTMRTGKYQIINDVILIQLILTLFQRIFYVDHPFFLEPISTKQNISLDFIVASFIVTFCWCIFRTSPKKPYALHN